MTLRAKRKLRLAVWKFTSCDGCQLALLDCEDELLALAAQVEFVHFLEASRRVGRPPYDLSLVEGSISTPGELARLRRVRDASRCLVTLGACATAGGLQALRNAADVAAWLPLIYPQPEQLKILAASTPIGAHVPVDHSLHGCPVNREQLLEVLTALLSGRKPDIPRHSLCIECKRAGRVCVTVAQGIPCLGPVTQAGCGALCPRFQRGCYGCFGPHENINVRAMENVWGALGARPDAMRSALEAFFPACGVSSSQGKSAEIGKNPQEGRRSGAGPRRG
jgi:coenzyme F420-reducing hydrogenase gamma subunit